MDCGNQVAEQIQALLNSKGISYRFMEHDPTPTSEDSARVRGNPIYEGAKAIIIRTSKTHKNYMVVLPGDKRIDKKKLKPIIKEDFSFEKPEVIREKFGLIIGGVPPFGFLLGIETIYDTQILNNENVSFNCGTQTKSIDMKVADFKKSVEGKWEAVS